jgi:membrane protease YdiL (CAAX protease family)
VHPRPPRAGQAAPAVGPRLLVVAAGGAWLLLRPGLWGLPGSVAVAALATGYLALGVVAARVQGPAGRPAPLGWPAVLAAGLAAVGAASLIGGPAVALRSDSAALGLVVLAAVAEEALFRGALYGLLERLGPVAAVPGSAVAFALLHVPLYGMAAVPVNLGAGLLFAWQRWASGRWTVPAATHAAANLLAVISR